MNRQRISPPRLQNPLAHNVHQYVMDEIRSDFYEQDIQSDFYNFVSLRKPDSGPEPIRDRPRNIFASFLGQNSPRSIYEERRAHIEDCRQYAPTPCS